MDPRAPCEGRRPRDIESRTFELACRIVRFCERQTIQGPQFRVVSVQLTKSATAVGAGLEEARAGQSRADFIAKVSIALKEARETLYWLRLMAACYPSTATEIGPLASASDEIVAILTTILKKSRLGGKPMA